ncbi:4Fe-4S binding protein [Oceanidesulfovibrio marinus]|uniref:4Fe-4S dicluster domain-containing protein n=1 Tax=Oceanidesulfovibrio marinus TaxID=370038 RepID=A0A6P1ZJR7_9BACT|nr:4Fe-4S binding protein [Oceanidesulfovibrio marinus]QJT09514.1 4Fe-4S dicluster domain-containing protein [Oceanidesulfovibrio marinus]TVM33826.1 oxidoreductase [Oceanidesulfovibrio marinus]
MTQNHELCKGCGYCILQCPKDALSLSSTVNRKGYNVVDLDQEKCILCAICYTVCPDSVFERVEA